MRKLNACLVIVVAIVFVASSQSAFAAAKGKHIDETKIVVPRATSKAKWNRVEQNINKHNNGIARQTKSVGTSSIMKTKHDTAKNPISNIR